VDILLVAAAFLLLAPVLSVQRTTDFMIFCIFVLAYDLLYGHMGRLSFGHMLYLGLGAYAAALCAEHLNDNPFFALFAGTLGGALAGVILGPIVVRTTGACFALINLAFNQVGENGMSASFAPIGGFDLGNRYLMFGVTLISLLVVVLLMRRLTDSPFGLLLRTIKENERRSIFLGYNTYLYKWLAFTISTAVAGFAGALSSLNYAFVTPSFIDPARSVEVIFAALIGGAGSVYGALVGGVAFMAISNYLPNFVQRWEMFLGVVLLLLVFKFREGIWGYLLRLQTARLGEKSR
jgi:branched-chain amino acid transport system permease protein